MANTFKNIKKKLRRKRLLAEKRHLEKAQAGAAHRIHNHQRLFDNPILIAERIGSGADSRPAFYARIDGGCPGQRGRVCFCNLEYWIGYFQTGAD